MIQTSYEDVKQRRDIRDAAKSMQQIGLLTGKKLEKCTELLERHTEILRVGNQASAEAGKQIHAAAERVAAGDADPIAEAPGIVPWEMAERIAVVAASAALDSARKLLHERASEIPETLNHMIDDAADELRTLQGQLDGVQDAQSAIDAGKVELWQEFTRMRGTIPAIHKLAYDFRQADLLWSPAPVDDQHWALSHRKEPVRGVSIWDQEPYVCSSESEFKEARRWRWAAWEGKHIQEPGFKPQNREGA